MPGLSRQNLYKAVLARDPRFDGRFFMGVRTTGIYCRPICPARPLLKNIHFYRSAAEAEVAGFRPCKRCRPDLSPSSPQWQGTDAIVKRALRLISQGEADALDLEAFASKLGVSGRHLRRLFEEHVGASPVEVISAQRLHLARLLLNQTSLPVTKVAFASGFRSIRRFNHAFLSRYKKSPKAFRGANSAGKELLFTLPVLEPFDWGYLIQFLRAHQIFGVEKVSEQRYERLILGATPGRLSVEKNDSGLLVKMEGIEAGQIRGLLARVRHLFDLDHNPAWASGGTTPKNLDGIRIPGAFSGFETAISIILGQMVSVEMAGQKMRKLVEQFGEEIESPYSGLHRAFPTPERLSAADFSNIGVTRVRSDAIREISRLVHIGELKLDRSAPLEATRARLSEIRGIGPWTVEMIAMRCLADPDAFPSGDLIVKRALENHGIEHEPWQPWRAYLSLWIWKNYAATLSKAPKKRSKS